MTSKQKIITLSTVGVVVVLLLAGYFAVLPQIQGSSYVSDVKVKQVALQAEAGKLKGLLEYDLFTKSNQTADEMRVDIKNAAEVVDSIKNKLSNERESLVSFSEYPLLSWHPTYSSALELNALEKTYTEKLNLAVTEMEAVLDYSDDVADIATRVEAAAQTFASVEQMTSVDEIVAAFEKAGKDQSKAVADMEKLTPPESYKEYHSKMVEANKNIAKFFDDFVLALKAGDADKLDELSADFDKAQMQSEAQGSELNKKIVEESVLRKYIDQVADTDNKINKILNKA